MRFRPGLAVLLSSLAATALAAKDPAAECEGRKLTLTGKYALCRLQARATAVRRDLVPDVQRCEASLAKKHARIERKFGDACPRLGDLETIRADVARFDGDVAAGAEGELVCSNDLGRLRTDPAIRRPAPAEGAAVGEGLVRVNEAVYMAPGFGNTFLVVTPAGNVVIDTSLSLFAEGHKRRLQAIDAGPVRWIILTHAHEDHVGGVDLWREEGTRVLAQREHTEFRHYSERLAPMLLHRNLSQFRQPFGLPPPPYAPPDAPVENYGADILATDLFDRFCEFRLGGLTFQIVHTPGETYDHLTVWIPEYGIAFTGDNYYGAFPNMYTLRGTRPRWALDYVQSIDRVLSWHPDIVAPSHTGPVYGRDEIRQTIGRYRDALEFVHDATVQGMNAGKDVFTLMNEIVLPPPLEIGEGYGAVAWSVRGIYEGYVGWFDTDPATMYAAPPSIVYPDLVTLAGGVDPVVTRAAELLAVGDAPGALRMTEAALSLDAANLAALETRLAALQVLLAATVNINESGWLVTAIEQVEDRIEELAP
jgi:alkyl sulfatase BDS1-like metallo-beta-lactamase superfamily hydrolase